MFEGLTDKMSNAIRALRGLSKITEDNIEDALKEVQSALLSADVHFQVVKAFIADVKQECLGKDVIQSVSPGQQMVKIIYDELVKMFGEGVAEISQEKPLKIMMVGLHGSGKTTSTVKLALHLKSKGYKPGVVACDVYRPAAIDQLELLANSSNIPVYTERDQKNVPKIGKHALNWAQEQEIDAIIFDTAGRLQIDKDLVNEIKDLKKVVSPQEVFIVADSALGQEAVNVSKDFHEAVQLTGIILTKLDGDARGGAALSMKKVTGAPIKFIGIGEKIDDFAVFHPERMAKRILGMGDVVSLVEKAQATMDKTKAEKLKEKLKKATFDLEDFLTQIQQIKKMGPLAGLAAMVPGMPKGQVGQEQEKQMLHTEALILSMTMKERLNPKIINGSRRKRIAEGAGLEVRDLNQLLKQFQMMQKMMKSMKGAKGKKMMKQLQAMSGNMPGMPKLG